MCYNTIACSLTIACSQGRAPFYQCTHLLAALYARACVTDGLALKLNNVHRYVTHIGPVLIYLHFVFVHYSVNCLLLASSNILSIGVGRSAGSR